MMNYEHDMRTRGLDVWFEWSSVAHTFRTIIFRVEVRSVRSGVLLTSDGAIRNGIRIRQTRRVLEGYQN